MKGFVSWAVSAGLVLAASAADAQMLTPYRAVSDFEGPYGRPYGALPPAPPPVYDDGAYGGGPALLPLHEVYAILRDNGFSPLGVPHQRGFVYTIAALDRNGEDGRLVIDGRNGRIIRFVPAYGYGPLGQGPYDRGSYEQAPYAPYDQGFPPERMSGYGPEGALPPPTVIRGTPRPPAPIPHVASRAVPLPAPKPAVAGTHQQSEAIATGSAAAPAPASAPQAAATVGEAIKPAPLIRPTQNMPKMQDLE